MAKIVPMPKLGLTMTEGTLLKWHKSEGEKINAGEVLFDVATDKLTNEVEATESGILRKLLVNEGDVVECLKPVAIIGEADEDITALLSETTPSDTESVSTASDSAVATKNPAVKSKEVGKVKASPAAKNLAKNNNINIEMVSGTGPDGRITLEDVENFIKSGPKKIKASPMAAKIAEAFNVDLTEIKKDSRIMKEDIYNYFRAQSAAAGSEPIEIRTLMTPMRKIISSRMSESWSVSPAVTLDIRVDVTKLKEIRNQLKNICKVTFTDLIIKIMSVALLEFPYLNSRIENDHIITRNYVNMGIAVALDGGLVVPVIKHSDKKGLKQISDEVKELAEKARNNELTKDNLTGGTFTITNLGMYGIESFSPIINQPEVAILGVNTIIETPIVVNEQILIKPLMNLSLTIDHRAVDGAVAAQFLAKIKEYIEKPEMLLL